MEIRLKTIVFVAVAVLAVSGCTGSSPTASAKETTPPASAKPARLIDADQIAGWNLICDLPKDTSSNLYHLDVSSDGRTANVTAYIGREMVDAEGQDKAIFIDQVQCMLLNLGAPKRIVDEVRTTPIDGTELGDQWDGFKVVWHVDGIRALFTITATG